jgi:hypothetical protein
LWFLDAHHDLYEFTCICLIHLECMIERGHLTSFEFFISKILWRKSRYPIPRPWVHQKSFTEIIKFKAKFQKMERKCTIPWRGNPR